MGYDEITVGQLPVYGNYGKGDSAQTADRELNHKGRWRKA